MAFRRQARPLLLGRAACDILFDMTLPKRLPYVLSAFAVSSGIFWYALSVSSDHPQLLRAILISAVLVWSFILPRGVKSIAWTFASAIIVIIAALIPSVGLDTFGLGIAYAILIVLFLCAPGILLAQGTRYVITRENIQTGVLVGVLLTVPALVYTIWELSWS